MVTVPADSLRKNQRHGHTNHSMSAAILEPVAEIVPQTSEMFLDADSREWLTALRSGRERDDAIARLHALLLRAARFEVGRRRRRCPTSGARSWTRSRTRPPTMR